MAALSFSSISYDSFRVRVTGMSTSSGTKGIVWYVNGEEYADWSDYDIAESTASSDRLTVDGLEPGTEYEVQAAIYYSDGWDDYVSDTVTTELYEPDFSSTEVVLRSSTTDSLTVRVEGLDTDYSGTWIFEFFLYNEYGDELDSISNSRSGGYSYSNSVTFDGLDPSTEYYIDAKIFYDIGDEQESTWTEKISGTTEAEEEYYEPDFSDTEINVNVDGTDVEITLDGLDKDYEDVWKVQWSVYAGDDWIVDGVTLRSDGYDTRWSFDRLTLNADDDGVQPNTQYKVIAYISTYPDIGGVGQLVAKNTTFTTGGTASADRPAKFTWADGTETKKSGQEFDITADEWCDLLDNINAVRVYKGYSEFPQGSYTLTYYYNYFTYPSSGQNFRYQHYNQALNAITGMLRYGYSDHVVGQNDAITADKINYLISTLNGIT